MPYIGKKPENIIATAVDTTTGDFSGVVTANAGIKVDNITIDGSEIDLSGTGDFTVDVGGDIILDSDGADILLKHDGTHWGSIFTNATPNNLFIQNMISDGDIYLSGNDGGSNINALILDMSDAGTATFNHDIKLGDNGMAIFGAGPDLRIFHDGSNSYIEENGTGDLIVQTNGANFLVENTDGDDMIKAISDGAVEISHNNVKRFETTANGAKITGSGASDTVLELTTGDFVYSGASNFDISHTSNNQNIQISSTGGGSLTRRIRIESNGDNYLFGGHAQDASLNLSSEGLTVQGGSLVTASKNSGVAFIANRNSDDGSVVLIRQDNTNEGTISVSGNTTSYNAFSGSHWSRLTDNSKPTILKGTVIETIDEMCDWYYAKFIENEETKVTDTIPIALPNGKSVGDTISVICRNVTYDDAVIMKENDNKHAKCKISDTADSKRVYGVYAAWDNDDDTVNDMYVTAVGTHVVRINKDVTVTAGDLLSSNGDGTAKVQDDDIIRSKTIGKVLTNIKQETYDDGSYIVPCALYCG